MPFLTLGTARELMAPREDGHGFAAPWSDSVGDRRCAPLDGPRRGRRPSLLRGPSDPAGTLLVEAARSAACRSAVGSATVGHMSSTTLAPVMAADRITQARLDDLGFAWLDALSAVYGGKSGAIRALVALDLQRAAEQAGGDALERLEVALEVGVDALPEGLLDRLAAQRLDDDPA